MTTKTIDDFGLSESTRYALDQAVLDRNILIDAGSIAPQARIEVSVPTYISHLNTFLGSEEKIIWAEIFPPPEYNMQRRNLFTSALIPSLGSDDQLQMQLERIQTQHDVQMEKRKEATAKEPGWELEREQRDEDAESKILSKMISQIQALNKDLQTCDALRKRYQKG